MKQSVAQKEENARGSFLVMFSWITLIFAFAVPLASHAQTVRSVSSLPVKILKSRFGLTDPQLNQLRPVIQHQAAALYKILNKYQDKNIACCDPFWADTDLWFDLRSVRQQPSTN